MHNKTCILYGNGKKVSPFKCVPFKIPIKFNNTFCYTFYCFTTIKSNQEDEKSNLIENVSNVARKSN